MLLVLGRDSDTVDGALDVSTRQELEGVTCVHREGSVLGFDPLPVPTIVVADLQTSHWLTVEESERSQVGVTFRQLLETREVLGLVLEIHHIAKVVFRFFFVLVDVGEVVFGELESNGEEDEELVENLCVAIPSKGFDFFNVLFQQIGVFDGEVLVKL